MRTQTLPIGSTVSNAPLYKSNDDGRARLVSLNENSQVIRIGNKLYAEDRLGNYIATKTRSPYYPKHVEESAVQGEVVVVARRRSGSGILSSEASAAKRAQDLEDVEDVDDEGDDEESEASSLCSDDEAYESWSECSADESVREYDSDNSSVKEADDEEPEDEDDGDEDKEDEKESSESSETESHTSDDDSSDDEAPTPNNSMEPMRDSFAVFDSTGRIFHFSQKVVPPLFESPPLIHPTRPLIVWPAGESAILFGDYMRKTFYTQSAWPSGSSCMCIA